MTHAATDAIKDGSAPVAGGAEAAEFGHAVGNVVAELSAMLAGDGAGLDVRWCDPATGSVGLLLELEGAECAECVLPPASLRGVVESKLRTVPGFSTLDLDDPRDAEQVANRATAAPEAMESGWIEIVDPTAGAVPGNPDPGPDAGPLQGKRIGIRVDVLWAAWDQTVEEWTTLLQQAGASVSTWRRAQGIKGAEGERLQAQYDAFVGASDIVISGLGNCGSCTSWSVKDGLNALNRGMPTVVAVTEQFETLGHTLASDDGRPALRLVVLPAFLNTLPEETVREAARKHYPDLLAALGAVTA
jgi:Fe-S cluster biogenesis protein NfuA